MEKEEMEIEAPRDDVRARRGWEVDDRTLTIWWRRRVVERQGRDEQPTDEPPPPEGREQ
jgi:hypothetical protein